MTLIRSLKDSKGFSLMEIIIAMVIISILIAISAYGISLLQQRSRDLLRTDALENIKSEITRYQNETGSNPKLGTQIIWTATKVTFDYPAPKTDRTVDLKGVATMKSLNNISSTSDNTGTAYYYITKSDGYVLGADYENGDKNIGTSKEKFQTTTYK